MINSTDPRYDRTESDLLDAFKILAGQKALNKISVSEITKLTGVTRSTFYNHYEDMPAFINAMEDRIIDEIFQIMNSFKPEGNIEICHQFFRSLCEYMKANRFLMIIIATPEAYDFVEKALTMFHRYVRLIGKIQQDRPGPGEILIRRSIRNRRRGWYPAQVCGG